MHKPIRQPIFEGIQLVQAYWLDLHVIDENEAKQRIFFLWQAGSTLYRFDDGFLLKLASPKQMHCQQIRALPLCEQHGVISSAPLHSEERALLHTGDICLVNAAQIRVLPLQLNNQIDPAIWLNLDHIPVYETIQIPAGPLTLSIPETGKEQSLQAILGNKVPSAEQASEAYQAVQKKLRKDSGHSLSSIALRSMLPIQFAAIAAVSGIAAVAMLGAQIIRKLSANNAQHYANEASTSSQTSAHTGHAPHGASSFRKSLNTLLARLAIISKVSRLIGRRQAAYLNDLMKKFESGDWQEALRHAIPLTKAGSETEKLQAFGVPGRRDQLKITGQSGYSNTIQIGDTAESHLRQLYRKAVEQLKRENRIEEAVYVLAELLNSPLEAINFLEEKERYRQAAELAELTQQSGEIIVRLWLMAKNMEKSMLVARRTNCFASLLATLERRNSDLQYQVREVWAEHLALQGNLISAAEQYWKIPDKREQALACLLQAERAGGSIGIRGLLMKLELMPESFADSLFSIESLLHGQADDGSVKRAYLANALLELKPKSGPNKRIAKELLRTLVPEYIGRLNRLTKSDLQALTKLANATVWNADIPSISVAEDAIAMPLLSRGTALDITHAEAGSQHIWDVVNLTDNQYLLALGESGILRVNSAGKVLARFASPAHHLVISENKQIALALAKRGETYRITKLNLLNASVKDWLSLPLTFWSPYFDGVIWSACIDKRILAIDTTQDSLSVNWQVSDLPGSISGFRENKLKQTILFDRQSELESWTYILPERRLISREIFEKFPQRADVHTELDENNGQLVTFYQTGVSSADKVSMSVKVSHKSDISITLEQFIGTPAIQIHGNLILITMQTHAGMMCQVFNKGNGANIANLNLPGTSQAHTVFRNEHIIFFDNIGRLIDLNWLNSDAQNVIVR